MTITLSSINIGTYDNDGTGDTLKAAGQKMNANFATLAGLFTSKGQASSEDYVYPDEFDSNLAWDASWNSTYDAGPALQAMIAQALVDGRQPALRAGRRYYSSLKLTFDPSRQGLNGNGSVIDYSLKSFTNPASQPELLSDPGFDTGTPWISSTNCSLNGAAAGTSSPTYSGSDMNWLTTDGQYSYLEIGQQITAPAGTLLQITVVVDEITTRVYGANTYRDVLFTLRAPVSGQSAAYSIGNGGNAGTFIDITNTSANYAAGTPATFTAQTRTTATNPYLRIQSNAQVRLASVSIKIVPDNTCMLLQVPASGSLRGHNYHEFCNFKIAGNSASANYVDGFEFDTEVSGFASRAIMRNIDASDNIGRCALFHNRAYLMDFINVRFVASISSVVTFAGSADAGENISFYGGNLGGGQIALNNPGGFRINMFGTSIDFSQQWYVGVGGWMMQSGWLEINAPASNTGPLIDCQGNGYVHISDTRVQVDGSTVAVLPTPFNVSSGGVLIIDADTPYNLHGTNGCLCSGAGRFRFVGRGGANKEMDSISKRDALHNLFGVGGSFDANTNSTINMWMSALAGTQVDRYTQSFPSLQTVVGDVYQGCDVVYNLTTAPTSAIQGKILNNSNVPTGTTCVSYQQAGAGFTASFNNGTNQLSSVSPAPTASVANNRFPLGTGMRVGSRIISYSNSGATLTLDQGQASAGTAVSFTQPNALLLSQKWNGPSATGVSLLFSSPNPETVSMLVSTDYFHSGTQSLKLRKGATGTVNAVAYVAFPIERNRAIGGEFWYKIPSGLTGTITVYFQAFLARLETPPGSLVPGINDSQLVTDQNSGAVDLSVGKDWSRIVFGTNRVDASSAHDGYAAEPHTHVIIAINISGAPSQFAMYLDDFFGCNL